MNDDLIKINHQLGKQIELLAQKLGVAIEGLEAIIFEGSDNLNISAKTLQAIKDCDKEFPHEKPEQ
tara:strand:+ start:418 stop:615 length:198 start_codon:yes stop_codon:yes gene_type:complete